MAVKYGVALNEENEANVIEKDTLDGIAAPIVITPDAQNERYIAVLPRALPDPRCQSGRGACGIDGSERP